MHARTPWILLAAVTVVAVSGLLTAGPLNPPTGPIAAGGKTTQEIYDAVTNISNSIGAVGGRGPAVPGSNRTAGTFTLNPSGGAAITGPILGLRHTLASPTSGGLFSGATALTGFTIVRELGTGSAGTYKAATAHQAIPTANVIVPSAGGNTTYDLSSAFIAALRQYDIQRADGSFAAIEEMDLVAQQVRVTEPNGTTWNQNYAP